MTANEAFYSYLNRFDVIARRELQRSLRRHLGVSRDVITNWRLGRTKIKPIYRREISNFFGENIFENVEIDEIY